MSPHHALRVRVAWPPRTARFLVVAGGVRLPRQPLWFTWRRKGKLGAAPSRPVPDRALRLTLMVNYRIDWGRQREIIETSVRTPGTAQHVHDVPRRFTAFRSAARAFGAITPWPVRPRAEDGVQAQNSPETRQRMGRAPLHAATPPGLRDGLPALARTTTPVRLLHRGSRLDNWQQWADEPVQARHPASSLGFVETSYRAPALAPTERTVPWPRRVARHAVPTQPDIGRTPLVLALRAASGPGPGRAQSPDPAPRRRSELGWREPKPGNDTPPPGQISSSRTSGTPMMAATTGLGFPTTASGRTDALVLEPAIAERLVQDVMRRVDRRMRIERERRGF